MSLTSSVTDDSPTLQTDVKWVRGSRRFQIRSIKRESVVGADLDKGGGCWLRSGFDDDKLKVENIDISETGENGSTWTLALKY
jgi:hypothetical protein